VLIDDDGNILLCDFGLSSFLGDGFTTATTAKFNLRWTAPEIIFPEGKDIRPSKLTDVYSFASVILQVRACVLFGLFRKMQILVLIGTDGSSSIPQHEA